MIKWVIIIWILFMAMLVWYGNSRASYSGRVYLIHKAESRFIQVGLEHKFDNFLKCIEGR